MKTWNQIVSEIVRLGGQEMSRYERAPQTFVQAVNRAAAVIGSALAEPLPMPVDELPDGQTFDLSVEAAAVLPLLAAFYVFEDEDERKAVRWREDAYDLLARFVAQKRGHAKVQEGESV